MGERVDVHAGGLGHSGLGKVDLLVRVIRDARVARIDPPALA